MADLNRDSCVEWKKKKKEEEEEEEFAMATKRVKSNKSATALRAVSRLNKLSSSAFFSRQNIFRIQLSILEKNNMVESDIID